MKKILALAMVLVMTAALFAGCSKGDGSSGSDADSGTGTPMGTPALADIHTKIKEVYGENYIPSRTIEAQELTEVYGLTSDNIDEVIAEGPMMSAHVDTFVAIKAKEGKGEAVEKELNVYRDKIVADTLQYPSNLPKINSSEVVRYGDYVFFVMLGAFSEDMEATEEDAANFAKAEVQKAKDALESFFK